jgi:hypothetical protein
MRRADPRQFGRKPAPPKPLTRQQKTARVAALSCLLLFAIALGAGLGANISEGGRVLLVVVAFAALVAGLAAAGEA